MKTIAPVLISLSTSVVGVASDLPSPTSSFKDICEFFPRNNIIPAIAATVYDQGRFQRFLCGATDLSRSSPPTSTTLFSVGSITKVFTVTLFAGEVWAGRLKLNDRVGKYLPELRSYPSGAITLEELATHHSGLEYLPDPFKPLNDGDPYVTYSIADLFNYLKHTTLGPKDYHYSSLGIALLAHIISVANHLSFSALVDQRLVKPLGISGHLYGSWSEELRPRFAKTYSNALEEIPQWTSLNALDASGVIRADLEGMEAFILSQLYPERVPQPLAQAICLSQQVRYYTREQVGVGLGWFFDTINNSVFMNQNGSTTGFTSELYLDLSGKRAIYYVGNADTLLPGACFVKAFTSGRCHFPKIYNLSSKQQTRFMGTYGYREESGWLGKIRILRQPKFGFLFVKFEEDDPGQRLYFDGKRTLYTDENLEFNFAQGRSGIFTEFWDRRAYSYRFWPH